MKKHFKKAILTIFTIIFCLPFYTSRSAAAVSLERYYAHRTVEDPYGVIAPWHPGQNGPLDTRLRIAVEVMKRYPWVDTQKAVMAAPDFVYNSHWSIKDDGTILIPPTNDWMCGDLSQRAWSIIKGLTAYYAYSGDPIAFLYIPLTADYILQYGQTGPDNPWPNFPIATPTRGKAYGKCDPAGRNQLDLCAIVGTEILRAYKLTGNEEYFAAAAHWGDVFAEKCNLSPDLPPWNRYTDPSVVGWSDELTGSTTLILEFLDDLINLGYTGDDRALIKARDAGRRYVRQLIENEWLENDTWARNYWDWDNPIICGIVSMCGDYIMKNPQAFPGWETDLRNILTLILNRNGADQNSAGNAFSGAWAFPESATCCGTSLSYNQYTAAPTLLRFGYLADDHRIREIGRRMMIMATYDSAENGVVKDGLYGDAVATGEWSNLAHPWPLCQVMEALAWTPELFGPKRENHILRSTSVVKSVVYQANRITYTTFDAPSPAQEVIRLAFEPTEITANGQKLPRRDNLKVNGYLLKELTDGDYTLTIRHDNLTEITIAGTTDPQQQIDDTQLEFNGKWQQTSPAEAFNQTQHHTAQKGDSFTFTFTGNQVRVLGLAGPSGGQADVYLDGEKQLTTLECWNPVERAQQLLYYHSGLKQAEHTLKIVARGQGNPTTKGKEIYIDSVQFSAAEAAAFFDEGSAPTDTQRMIFGYPLREDYIDSNGNAWRPATEWVTRSGYGRDVVKEAWWTNRRSMYIGNTPDEEIYRYGVHAPELWANITVGAGTYYVKMKFADTPLHPFLERDKDGKPITHTVDIKINEEEVVSDMNIAQAAGGTYLAVDKIIKNVKPQNGMIEVYVIGQNENGAAIQAMEVGLMETLSE